jgi:hypothetical protein
MLHELMFQLIILSKDASYNSKYPCTIQAFKIHNLYFDDIPKTNIFLIINYFQVLILVNTLHSWIR